MENNIKKVHTGKDLAISAVIILIGAGLFFVNKAVGVVIALCGILSLLLLKCGYKNNNENPVLKKMSLELRRACRQSIIDFLNGNDNNPKLELGNEGGTILLDVWFNANENVAYAQLSDFQDFNFQKATEIVKLDSESAKILISKIAK